MGPGLTKIQANLLATENKLYYDTNGDVYIGRSGRLIFLRTGEATTTTTTTSSGTDTNRTTNTIILTEVVGDDCCDTAEESNNTLTNIAEDLDQLLLSQDRSNQTPLYVEDQAGALKRDDEKALVLSDAKIFNIVSNAAIHRVIDTQGYQSIQIIAATLGASVTPTFSNDGITYITVAGLSSTFTTAVASASSNAACSFPITGRYLRLTGAAGSSCAYTLVLRNIPFVPMSTQGLITNISAVNGTAPPSAGVAGILSVGGNIAPGSARTENPLPIAGTDLNNITRVVRTDTVGRIIVSANDPLTPTVGSLPLQAKLNTLGQSTLLVQDTNTSNGQTIGDILIEILAELKMTNYLLNELPQSIGVVNPLQVDLDNLRQDFIN